MATNAGALAVHPLTIWPPAIPKCNAEENPNGLICKIRAIQALSAVSYLLNIANLPLSGFYAHENFQNDSNVFGGLLILGIIFSVGAIIGTRVTLYNLKNKIISKLENTHQVSYKRTHLDYIL